MNVRWLTPGIPDLNETDYMFFDSFLTSPLLVTHSFVALSSSLLKS